MNETGPDGTRRPRVGLVSDPRYLDHREVGHPERPERLERVAEVLEETGLAGRLIALDPDRLVEGDLRAVHAERQIDAVRTCSAAGGHLGADTYVSKGSFEIACLAAGGAVRAVDAVLDGELDRVFCALRPPGHHATAVLSMGFCLFNNVALAAAHARARGLERILIFDWDVHHGNGTQDIFYRDGHVVFASTHQHPLYPGTGMVHETGEAEGRGATVNVALPPGVGDEGFARVMDEILDPLVERVRPELVLLSAGYDAHHRDPLGSLGLTSGAFHRMAERMVAGAECHAGGRVIVCLEGGYDLEAMGWCSAATVAALLGEGCPEDPLGAGPAAEPDIRALTREIASLHGLRTS